MNDNPAETTEESQVLRRSDILAKVSIAQTGERTWAAVAKLLADRFSCRGFRPDPLSRVVLEELFTVSQLSASWCNSQPWQVLLTSGPATDRFREALTSYAEATPGLRQPDIPFPEAYQGVFDERRKQCGWQLYEAVGVKKGDRAASYQQTLENFRLFGAPHAAIITTDRALGAYGAIDCGVFLGNLMLAAQSRGIVTIAQASLAMVAPFIREYFNISQDRLVVCGLSLGYADHDAPANSFRTDRAPIEQVVQWYEN